MKPYKTIQDEACAEIIEKKSRFIAHAVPVESEEKALAFLEHIRAEHRMARHNVYAYVLREGNRVRYSDDGEPQKTAGLPTLEAIQHAGLSDVIVVVTRYFGGTLLGTGGLVRAYTQAAQAALAAAEIVTFSVCREISLRIPYGQYEQTLRLAEQEGAKVQKSDFADEVYLGLLILDGEHQDFVEKMSELLRGDERMMISEPFTAPF